MRRAGWLILSLYAVACGDDDGVLTYEGIPGTVDTDFSDEIPIVSIAVDDRESPFLVDSGAPFTILDKPSFADATDGEGLFRADMGMWGIDVRDFIVVVTPVFDPGSGISGLLGGDFLRHFALELDYRAEQSTLWDPYEPPGDTIAVPFELLGGGPSYVPCSMGLSCGTFQVAATRIIVPARFEGSATPYWIVVDTGASAVVLDDSFWDLLEQDSPGRPKLDGIQVDTVEGLLTGFLSRVWRMSLGSEDVGAEVALDDVPVLVIPGDNLVDGISLEVGRPVVALVGGTFLRMHRTIIDYQERNLHLARYDSTPHVPVDEFVQIGLELTRSADLIVVATVYGGTDAAAELIEAGDVVVTIGGMDLTGLSDAQVSALAFLHNEGDEVAMGIRKPSSDVVEDKLVTVENLLPSFPPP